jgi:sugar O-acyltransferase (sialic acid O-acetyltransferase NeuD family)
MTIQDKPSKIVIVGAGEIARLAYEYFTHDSPHDIVAFSVENAFLDGGDLFGLPVVSFEEVERSYDPGNYKLFVAISYVKLNRVRTRLYEQAKAKGYTLASYVSSTAHVWRNVEIGENCFILEGNILQYGVAIGNNVTMWGGNHVGHHSAIRDNCFVTGHVLIAGRSEIGRNCFLGASSCIGDYVSVGEDCVIGAGAVVLKDTEARKVYRGNPAKPAAVDSFIAFNVTGAVTAERTIKPNNVVAPE